MILFPKILNDHSSEHLFILYSVPIKHFLHLFPKRQTAIDFSYGIVSTFSKHSPKRTLTSEYLNLDSFLKDSVELCRVTFVNIMQVNSSSALGKLGISSRPQISCIKIKLQILITILVLLIEVDYDMNNRSQHIMQFMSVDILKLCLYLVPFLWRKTVLICKLSRIVSQNIIQQTFLLLEIEPILWRLLAFLFSFTWQHNGCYFLLFET